MKVDKHILGHREGMAYSYKIISECEPGKERETLAEELKFRGLTNVPITVSRKDIEAAFREMRIQDIDYNLTVTLAVLHDKFGFGQKRIQKFVKHYNNLTESIADDYCSLMDNKIMLKEEAKIDICLK